MNNGLTERFVVALVLAGSRAATTDAERRLVVFIAAQDQAIRGRGAVGFDITEMPWGAGASGELRHFLVTVAGRALGELRGRAGELPPDYVLTEPESELGELQPRQDAFWTPSTEQLAGALRAFAEMISNYEETSEDPAPFPLEPSPPYELCRLHSVLLHAYGCVVCNSLSGARGGSTRID